PPRRDAGGGPGPDFRSCGIHPLGAARDDGRLRLLPLLRRYLHHPRHGLCEDPCAGARHRARVRNARVWLMASKKDNEERQLRSVALQNAQAILVARQRAERELAAERERLRITLASIGDAVISTDALGRVTYLNGVAEALTGWTQ